MASREKKPTASKKQIVDASHTQQKESLTPFALNQSDGKIKRRKINPTKKVAKRVGKKVLALSLKAKDKKPQFSKKMVKVLLSNIDAKKNGVILPPKKIIKKKSETTSVQMEQVSVEKKTKRSTAATLKPIKTDNTESLSKIDDTINSILKQILHDEQAMLTKPKKTRIRKPKIETTTPKTPEVPVRDTVSETIEDVMKDLASLLKSEDDEAMSEVIIVKNPKEKEIQHSLILDDNITIDASAKHLIDMLDLSVSKTQKLTTSPEICIRRHSIEKLSNTRSTALVSNVPRINISKINRSSKCRISLDGGLKRSSPYNTRSDSPAQKLRNGKPRKMKENLLEGIIDVKKRRKRVGSEYSGSEKSKLSGYESDSSFSDLSTNLECKRDVKVLLSNGVEDEIKSECLTDDNSNLCSNPGTCSPCPKVLEKSILLDNMKQAFNDINIDEEKTDIVEETDLIPTEKFYSKKFKSDEAVMESLLPTDSILNDFEPDLPSQENHISKSDISTTDSVQKKVMDSKDDDASLQSPKPNAQFVIDEAILQSKVDEIIKSMEEDDVESEHLELSKEKEKPRLELKGDDIPFETVTEKKPDNDEHVFESNSTKESILQALGLQSLKAVEEAKLKEKLVKSDYTGSLKTVIKINRIDKTKRRNFLKLSAPAYKYEVDVSDHSLKLKESSSSNIWKTQNLSAQSSDTAGAPRKSHNSNRINMDGSSEHNSDVDTLITENDDPYKVLVIPEKASSFSIHPDRLCKDECSYCFGKFGLFDTPCHIAQMKSIERQDKILEAEKHLMRDSCLCDACYRHVDRKSNTPSYLNKGSKRNSIIAPGPRQNHCHVLSCINVASHILRRKWIIKMRKSVSKLINIDLDNPGLHSIPICDAHYLAVEHLMICAMCKRRLARNQIHYLGAETKDLNTSLNTAGIPVKLFDKPVVCKMCRYFASLILKPARDRPDNTINFFRDYRRRLLHAHNIEVMEEVIEEEDLLLPSKDKLEKDTPTKKKRKLHHKSINNIGPPILEPQVDLEKMDHACSAPSESNSTGKSRSESPSEYMVDYNTLIPNIAMECGSDPETSRKTLAQVKNKSVHLIPNSCISVRELFPGEEELGLQCYIDFRNINEKTPEGWERCNTIIQYDTETKMLWQALQKPYGNQSSFLRHLVLLEKYFRSGDLILASNASNQSINYSESVQNRLRAYDNIPKDSCPPINHRPSGIITTKDPSIINAANIPKNTPITITQINNITPTIVNKTRIPPPGLISLHSSNARPKTPALVKTPQTNKIKIPLTKNWRPTLIPVDPTKKSDKDKKPGYVKVVSNNKPYYITVDDYNRMCAIKKSYDLKQKRLLEAAQAPPGPIIKNISVRKGLIISKASPTKAETEFETSTVENYEAESNNSMMILPKMPKSLTVIPQTVQQIKLSPPLNTNTLTSNKS